MIIVLYISIEGLKLYLQTGSASVSYTKSDIFCNEIHIDVEKVEVDVQWGLHHIKRKNLGE